MRLNQNHRPHGHEGKESGTEEVVDNHHQCCQWRHPYLDHLA
jgi:hypothetical protein